VAQAAAQDRLDVRLRVGAVGVVVDARPLRTAGAAPLGAGAPALEQSGGLDERVAAVAVAREKISVCHQCDTPWRRLSRPLP